MHQIPFDLAAMQDKSNWQENFEWPLDHVSIYHPGMTFVRGVMCGFDMLPKGEIKDIFLICLPRVIATGLSIIETAMWVQEAEKRGLSFFGGPPEVFFLSGRKIPHKAEFTPPAEPIRKILRFAFFRQIARTMSWTPLHKLPLSFLFPAAIAISHNSLLRVNASLQSVKFVHADSLLVGDVSWKVNPDQTEAMLALVCKEVDKINLLLPQKREIVKQLIMKSCIPHCYEAQFLMHSARLISKMPSQIWGGAGGYRPARAIRIEARRRGSWVVGHDHSCMAGMILEKESSVLSDLCVADEFVLPTKKSVEMFGQDCSTSLLRNTGQAKLSWLRGDPTMVTDRCHRGDNNRRVGKPRVLYVSGAFIGFRQRIPPRIPDIVKLDWQIRLVKMLNSMNIEFKSQMHPGGVLQGKPHPANAFCSSSNLRFEEAKDWAEVFVFDVIQSSTFPMALVSHKPIVLIDHGMNAFNKDMKSLLNQRCLILNVERDERNRITINSGLLEQSIMEAANMSPDPTPFSDMYAGDHSLK